VPSLPRPGPCRDRHGGEHSYAEIIGSPAAPYLNALAAQGATMTNSFGVEHPSQPNYLDFFPAPTRASRTTLTTQLRGTGPGR